MSAIKIIVWNHVGTPSSVTEDLLLLVPPAQSFSTDCDNAAAESAQIFSQSGSATFCCGVAVCEAGRSR